MAEEKKRTETESYRQFQTAESFKEYINLPKEIKRCVLFENGFQWLMDEEIEDYRKITLNIIKQIGKTQKSYVMQNEYAYLVNSTNFEDNRKIQDFLKHMSQAMRLRAKDLKALSDDYIKGTAIGYFFYDNEKRNFLNAGGATRFEMIDIRRFAIANPYLQSIQDQEWVMYVTEETVRSIKWKYGKDVPPDGKIFTTDTEHNIPTDKYEDERVNVYTKFYRNYEGEVFFTIETQTEVLKEPTPMNPYYEGTDSKIRPESMMLPDEKESKKDIRAKKIWNLYPFVRLCLNERDNCFYGVPLALEYVETQKSINNHYSVYDKALQDNVLGGWVYREGVLGSQELTTDTAQMIGLDLLPNEKIQDVFGRLPAANIPNDSERHSQSLINVTRSVSGATNVQLGMSDYSGQSGKQTQLLLQRAQENASDRAILFNEYKKDQAYIMFLFAQFYYDNEDFVVTEHGADEDIVRQYMGENSFNGAKYVNDKILIDIRVGAAPSFSEYANIELLGLMVQSGQLPAEVYLKALPDGYISNRQELLKYINDNDARVIEQLKMQIQEYQKAMSQMAQEYKRTQEDRNNIDTIIRENEKLRSMLAEVSANSIKQMSDVTEQQRQMTSDIQRLLEIMSQK